MYVSPNFKSKKALKDAVAAGERVTLLSNSPFDKLPLNGTATVEGPHSPKPHTWYGQVVVENGKIVKVK